MENLKDKTIPMTRRNKQKAPHHQVKKLDHVAKNDPMSYRNHSHIPTCLHILPVLQLLLGDQDSVVSTVTSYRPDGLGYKPWQGWDFPHLHRPAPKPTQSPVQCVLNLFSRCKGRWGSVWVQLRLYLPLWLHAMSQGDLYLYLMVITY